MGDYYSEKLSAERLRRVYEIAPPRVRQYLRADIGHAVEQIRPGDIVWFPPGEKHWHGAAPDTAMTHIAIQETLDGKSVDWLEHVSDEQYGS